METSTAIYILGIAVVAVINSIGMAIVAFINWRAGISASRNAVKAQDATARAALSAAELIKTARDGNAKLSVISNTTDITHKIVNSQHTAILNVVAALWERIARENPVDQAAQLAASNARRDAESAA